MPELRLKCSNDGVEETSPVIRAFLVGAEEFLVITGNDFDNHAIWYLKDTTAWHVGTLKEKNYKQSRRVRKLSLTVSVEHEFDFVDRSIITGKTLSGVVDSPNMDITYTFQNES